MSFTPTAGVDFAVGSFGCMPRRRQLTGDTEDQPGHRLVYDADGHRARGRRRHRALEGRIEDLHCLPAQGIDETRPRGSRRPDQRAHLSNSIVPRQHRERHHRFGGTVPAHVANGQAGRGSGAHTPTVRALIADSSAAIARCLGQGQLAEMDRCASAILLARSLSSTKTRLPLLS